MSNSSEQKLLQEKIFEAAYNELNDRQKEAVRQIEGPVFVLAGPGTGKTQILALRIGHILKTTDTQPHNILCLTYTDAGTIAMRKRLVEFIGSAAYNVHIFTFHAFANQVIQENMYLFGSIRELRPLSDLEKSEVFVELIDNIPNDNPLKRFKGAVYYEKQRLENLFRDMKKEGWTKEHIGQCIDSYLEEQKTNPEMLYKRRSSKDGKTFEKGDLKETAYRGLEESMEALRAGAGLFAEYEKMMKAKGRYDYDDMILWVLGEFERNEQLLLRYQEQYQYFLVDEYQDTNGVQNKLLEILADYWDNPNVFAVGDDDQSIYRFQGANMENIVEFQQKYNPQLVVLDRNYRSSQIILDASAGVINKNLNRLSNVLGIDKTITAGGPNAAVDVPVNVLEYPNHSQEEAAIYQKILELADNHTDLNKVAVIYRNNKQVEGLTKILELKNIPVNVRRKVNILNEPFIKNLLDLLRFIQSEYRESGSREDLLFKTLISPMFKISYADVMKLGKLGSTKDAMGQYPGWMNVIADSDLMLQNGVREYERIHSIYNCLAGWLQEAPGLTVQLFFEKVITEGGLLKDALTAPDKKWKMQLLNTFFDFIKAESVRNPKLDLKQFLESIEKMEMSGVELPMMKIASSEDGVHFITGHSAKGLEFDQVFILGTTADQWESKRASSNTFKYPDTLFIHPVDRQEEDERRVFYVASTRAERQLTISYAAARDDGKELEASRFITEMKESGAKIQFRQMMVPDGPLLDYKSGTMEFVELPLAEMLDPELIRAELETLEMSVTALNKYLRCPISYYYENILRVPFARNSYAGFGSAVHYALEQFFQEKKASKTKGFGSAKLLTDFFHKGMRIYRSHFNDKEFENLSHFGEQTLTDYHTDQLDRWFSTEDYRLEHKISHVEFRGVPIKGIIDKIEIFGNDQVNVIDYKTGKPENARKKMNPPKNEEDPGGDYWRQIVFYKMLVDNDPKTRWRVQSGEINLVEPDKQHKFQHFKMVVSQKDLEIVGDQLVDSYTRIMNHEFSRGCGEENCMWCNFVKERVLDLNKLQREPEE